MYTVNPKINNQLSLWLITMFWIIAIMIVVGGLTRLSDSGLSITEWQLFSGILPPLNNNDWIMYFNLYKKIPEYELQNYNMTLQEFKIIFWWEWGHRFLGRVIGISFLIPLFYFSFRIEFYKLLNLYLIFFLICFQGFVGWYMFSSGLVDRVDVSHFRLSIHLLIAFLILSLIFWNYLKTKVINNNTRRISVFLPLIFLILVFIQIVVGAFVSGMDAGKIYNSWPLMGNTYFPNDNDFKDLFRLSAFSDPSLVQFIHRNLAYLMTFYILILGLYIFLKNLKNLFYPFKLLLFLLLIQIFLGIFTLISDLNIYLSSAHQINSVILVFSAINLYYLRTK